VSAPLGHRNRVLDARGGDRVEQHPVREMGFRAPAELSELTLPPYGWKSTEMVRYYARQRWQAAVGA